MWDFSMMICNGSIRDILKLTCFFEIDQLPQMRFPHLTWLVFKRENRFGGCLKADHIVQKIEQLENFRKKLEKK